MDKVRKLIKKEFKGSPCKRLGKGCINISYEVEDSIFRFFPRDGWKAKKEKYLYSLIKRKTSLPIPKVHKVGKDYIILSKIKGKGISLKNKKLIEKAGEYLAKLHKIKFNQFGWIIGDKIKPSFSRWADFLEYDLKHKIDKADKIIPKELLCKISVYFDKNKKLLNINSKPCLLHKDYHSSHIIANKGEINGIIDFEWAIAGHNEMDLAKSCLWMFYKDKKFEKIFLNGYKKHNKISKDFAKRRRVYELLILFSSLIFSCDLKSKKWYDYNLKKIKRILNGKHN